MNFQISSDKIGNPLLIELLSVVNECFKEVGQDFFVIGATARDILIRQLVGISSGRKTRDLDLAIAIPNWKAFDDITQTLLSHGFTKEVFKGIALSINALFSNTAALPKIEFTEPETVLGINTVSQINAGIFYGNVGSIKELILQYKKFFPNAYVIATGGQGEKISEYIEQIDEYVPKLGEMGIFEFYRLNLMKRNNRKK